MPEHKLDIAANVIEGINNKNVDFFKTLPTLMLSQDKKEDKKAKATKESSGKKYCLCTFWILIIVLILKGLHIDKC